MTEMPVQPTPSRRQKDPLPEGRRRVGWLLGIGIFVLPYVFVWWLLRKGHSTLSRVLGFGWLALALLVWIAGANAPPADALNTAGTAESSNAAPEESEAEKAARAADAQRRADEQKMRELRRSPEKFLTLENANGVKGGFDTVFMLSGTIRNSSDVVIKDARIDCNLFGPSGTQVGKVRQTLFEQIPAEGSRRFRELSMGFMGSSQVATYNCTITDAEALVP